MGYTGLLRIRAEALQEISSATQSMPTYGNCIMLRPVNEVDTAVGVLRCASLMI